MSRKAVRFLVVALAVLAPLGLAGWTYWPRPVPPPEWVADYDVTAKPADGIAPGTVVGTSAPEGWSHLVIKSLPRLRAGEKPKLPRLTRDQTAEMIGWMKPVFLADVRAGEPGPGPRHRLRAVGLGMATAVGGRDVIVTPETAAAHGVKLGWITETILKKGCETQRRAVVVVHGPTLGVVDTPVWFRCGDKNRLIRFRYALLVDGPTGRLDVLLWTLDPAGGCGDTTTAALLKTDAIDEAELIPDPKEFDLLGIASDAAFGIDRLPPPQRGRVSFPPELRELTAKTRFTADEARALEAGLRALLP